MKKGITSIDALKTNDFVFLGEPRQYELYDYLNLEAKITDWAIHDVETLGIQAIYRFGTISNPGISDLDLIIVVDDRMFIQKQTKFILFLLKLTMKRILKQKDWDYILLHNPFIVPASLVKDFSKIFPIFSYSSIFQAEHDSIIFNTTAQNDMLWNFIDLCPQNWARYFVSILARRKIDLRECLLYLNSLKYAIHMCKEITGRLEKSWSNYIKEVTVLRKNWFRLPSATKKKDVIELVKNAAYISFEINESLHCFLERNLTICSIDVWYKHPKLNLFFPSNWNPYDALEKQFRLQQRGVSLIILPSTFSIPPRYYALRDGAFATHIKKHLYVANHRKPVRSFLGLRERYELLERYVQLTPKRVLVLEQRVPLYGYLLRTAPFVSANEHYYISLLISALLVF